MKSWVALLASGLLVGGVALLPAQGSPPPVDPRDGPPVRESGDGDGAGCVSGCGQADDTPPTLSEERYLELVQRFAGEPAQAGSEALEELLFHHVAAEPLLERLGTGPLDSARAEVLRRELGRKTVWLDVRVLDSDGVERVRLAPRRVPMGEKQHLVPEVHVDIQTLAISGTVRRVGLDHLWTRL